jgi:hypothetical protein
VLVGGLKYGVRKMHHEKELMTTTTALPVTLSKLVSRHEVAERTAAFRFEKAGVDDDSIHAEQFAGY